MALPRLRVCQERSAVRQQWPGSSQDVLRAHERLSWMEPWQLLWRRVDICSSSSISRSATTRSSRLRRSPILHACASCSLLILWYATALPCATSTPSLACSSISRLCNVPSRLMLRCCPRFHSEINSCPRTDSPSHLALYQRPCSLVDSLQFQFRTDSPSHLASNYHAGVLSKSLFQF